VSTDPGFRVVVERSWIPARHYGAGAAQVNQTKSDAPEL